MLVQLLLSHGVSYFAILRAGPAMVGHGHDRGRLRDIHLANQVGNNESIIGTQLRNTLAIFSRSHPTMHLTAVCQQRLEIRLH